MFNAGIKIRSGNDLIAHQLKMEPVIINLEWIENIQIVIFAAVHQRASQPVVAPLVGFLPRT
ncbi:hypothetical protein D3C86_2072000 [compost metagenome]